MPDRQLQMKLFHSDPPRLFPHVPHQRPVIEGLLAQLAYSDPVRYEERLKAYNELADKFQAERFGRLLIVKEQQEQPAPAPVAAKAAPQPAAPAPEKPAPAKKGKGKSK